MLLQGLREVAQIGEEVLHVANDLLLELALYDTKTIKVNKYFQARQNDDSSACAWHASTYQVCYLLGRCPGLVNFQVLLDRCERVAGNLLAVRQDGVKASANIKLLDFSRTAVKCHHLHLDVGLNRVVVLAHDGRKEEREQYHGGLSKLVPHIECPPI